ncbi:hypothetical protein [Kitasatospora acidiphila]|uniref:hypothetical protein n=1 Tax=Kitasatospora acidiphila TaxID=2567942 RepID=UPI003C7375D3
MAAVNVSKIDRRVRREVERRGLFLVSPDLDRDTPEPTVFLCTNPDPGDCGFTRVGFVTHSLGHFVVYAMDGRSVRAAVSLDQVRGYFPTWEAGLAVVLRAYDQFH